MSEPPNNIYFHFDQTTDPNTGALIVTCWEDEDVEKKVSPTENKDPDQQIQQIVQNKNLPSSSSNQIPPPLNVTRTSLSVQETTPSSKPFKKDHFVIPLTSTTTTSSKQTVPDQPRQTSGTPFPSSPQASNLVSSLFATGSYPHSPSNNYHGFPLPTTTTTSTDPKKSVNPSSNRKASTSNYFPNPLSIPHDEKSFPTFNATRPRAQSETPLHSKNNDLSSSQKESATWTVLFQNNQATLSNDVTLQVTPNTPLAMALEKLKKELVDPAVSTLDIQKELPIQSFQLFQPYSIQKQDQKDRANGILLIKRITKDSQGPMQSIPPESIVLFNEKFNAPEFQLLQKKKKFPSLRKTKVPSVKEIRIVEVSIKNIGTTTFVLPQHATVVVKNPKIENIDPSLYLLEVKK